jgi:predicted methyltransferase
MTSPPRRTGSAARGAAHCAVVAGLIVVGCAGDRLPSHYADPSAMIQVFEAEERDAWQEPERVVRSLPLENKHAVVADIGAGSGYFTRRLATEVSEGKVYAVDVDATFEQHLIENREVWGLPNIEPHLAHYEDPMLPGDTLDLVFTANTYSYLRDRTSYFQKVHRALKAGGHLAILDFRPVATPPADVAPESRHRVPQATVISEVEAAGFKLNREETFLRHQYFLVFQRIP